MERWNIVALCRSTVYNGPWNEGSSLPVLFDECLKREQDLSAFLPPLTPFQTHRGTILSIKLAPLPGAMCDTIDDI